MSTIQPRVAQAGVAQPQAASRRQAVLQTFVLLTVVLHSAWVGTALIVWPHHANFTNVTTLWWGPWVLLLYLPMLIGLRAYVETSCAFVPMLTLGLWVASVCFPLNAGLVRTAGVVTLFLSAGFFLLTYRELWVAQ